MNKELAVKTVNGLQLFTPTDAIGVASNLSSTDIQMPCLMLMQANSTFVQEDDNINSGDFLHSITREVWGKKDKDPVELVFFDMFKTQIVSDVTENKKWMATNQWNEDMELEPYEEIIEGRTIRREKCFNYMCFRPLETMEVPDMATGEVIYTAIPIVIKFKGGSLKNGKRLNNIFQTYAQCGAQSWASTFQLKANLEENDGNKYWAYDFVKGGQSTKEQQLAAYSLCKKMQGLKDTITVVDEDEAPKDVTPEREIKNHAPGAGDVA